jgi:hypothetical protein
VWSGDSFPYLNLLAVRSLRTVEPDATVDVHFVGRVPASPHVVELVRDSAVSVKVLDEAETLARLDADFPGVAALYASLPAHAASARSNVLRYALLWEHGGVYLDFDTFVLRPFDRLDGDRAFVGEEFVWVGNRRRVEGDAFVFARPSTWHWALSWTVRRLDSAVASGTFGAADLLASGDAAWRRLQVNNAVIGAPRRSPFIAALLRALPDCAPDVRYSTGPTLVDSIARSMPDLVHVRPATEFYAVPPGESFRLFEDVTLTLPAEATVVHWVSSNHRRIVSNTDVDCRFGIRPGSVVDTLLDRLEGRVTRPVAADAFRETAYM